MDPAFALRVEENGQGSVVHLAGELDLSTAPALRQCLEELDGASVSLDFSDVTFMDSSALGVLIAARNSAEQNGAAMTLRNVTAGPLRVFEVAGLVDRFQLEGHALD